MGRDNVLVASLILALSVTNEGGRKEENRQLGEGKAGDTLDLTAMVTLRCHYQKNWDGTSSLTIPEGQTRLAGGTKPLKVVRVVKKRNKRCCRVILQ